MRTEQLGECLTCYSITPQKLKDLYGLLSAIAAAWQEGCSGLSSDSGRDFQPCSVKAVGENWKDSCNITTFTDSTGENAAYHIYGYVQKQ